ncbi:MAG: DNA polymerase IV [Candidatus Rokubacteria bacterium]|nr:DNA polymerase IV [Candidatus Rokubacteria bacterium]MBI3827180.1 DNA polymerase IV [Candidatus Rokubacteria bacterium]
MPPARAIAHVDMDAFYASVEQRDRPELRGRPVIVGGAPGGRGVVSAASYEARPWGVRSAMPISRAARLCPHAAFLPVDMEKYQRVSTEIMAILGRFSPLVEPVSVDEAFVDLTGTASLFGPPAGAVAAIKAAIRTETALTASAGLAPNKFLAKVASELEKPDGLVVVAPGTEAAFLAPLPIERLWGVGRVMGQSLRDMGVTTVGRLQALPRDTLVRRFGAHGADLHDLAFGRDERPVVPSTAPKSIGAETTFGRDRRDTRHLHATLRSHAERVARELRDQHLRAATITLKLRFADFSTITRAVSGEPTQDGLEIFRRARDLFDRETLHLAVRLLGVSASGLGPEDAGQLPLLDPGAVKRDRVARAVDRLTDRFGEGAVRPASLLDRDDRDG